MYISGDKKVTSSLYVPGLSDENDNDNDYDDDDDYEGN